MACCASSMDGVQLEVSYSGGGYRAFQSSAVFRLILQETGLWQDVKRATGVSGGSWFIQAEQHPHGNLRGVYEESNIDMDRLMNHLIGRGLIPEWTMGQKQRVKANDCPVISQKVMEIAKGMVGAAPFLLVKPLIKKPVDFTVLSFVDSYGSGLSYMVSDKPLEYYKNYLATALFQEGGSAQQQQALNGSSGDPRKMSYDTTWRPIGAPDATKGHPDHLHQPLAQTDMTRQYHLAACGFPTQQDKIEDYDWYWFDLREPQTIHKLTGNRAMDVTKEPGCTQLLSAPFVAAICGSAFAVNLKAIFQNVGAKVEKKTQMMSLKNSSFQPLYKGTAWETNLGGVQTTIHDAGISINLAFPLHRDRSNSDNKVVMMLDCSAGSTQQTIKNEFVRAMPSENYTVYKFFGWNLYVRAKGDTRPKFVGYFFGLTDSCTFEVDSKEKRVNNLVALYPKLKKEVLEFQQQLDLLVRVCKGSCKEFLKNHHQEVRAAAHTSVVEANSRHRAAGVGWAALRRVAKRGSVQQQYDAGQKRMQEHQHQHQPVHSPPHGGGSGNSNNTSYLNTSNGSSYYPETQPAPMQHHQSCYQQQQHQNLNVSNTSSGGTYPAGYPAGYPSKR